MVGFFAVGLKCLRFVDTSPVCSVCLKSCDLLPSRALHEEGATGETKLVRVFKRTTQPHHDKSPTFLLAGRLSAPSHAAPAGQPLLVAKPLWW